MKTIRKLSKETLPKLLFLVMLMPTSTPEDVWTPLFIFRPFHSTSQGHLIFQILKGHSCKTSTPCLPSLSLDLPKLPGFCIMSYHPPLKHCQAPESRNINGLTGIENVSSIHQFPGISPRMPSVPTNKNNSIIPLIKPLFCISSSPGYPPPLQVSTSLDKRH